MNDERDHGDEIALTRLRDRLRDFASLRDWNQFHSPKNLAIALSVEVGELLEHFQWISDQDSLTMPPDKLGAIKDEVADVFLYLIRLADILNVDMVQAANEKVDANSRKYPIEKSRGSAKKYTEL
jgi:NTP pyrophosphatase (non-canonical NTP hydrolase)